jgi:hypothetical protein
MTRLTISFLPCTALSTFSTSRWKVPWNQAACSGVIVMSVGFLVVREFV